MDQGQGCERREKGTGVGVRHVDEADPAVRSRGSSSPVSVSGWPWTLTGLDRLMALGIGDPVTQDGAWPEQAFSYRPRRPADFLMIFDMLRVSML